MLPITCHGCPWTGHSKRERPHITVHEFPEIHSPSHQSLSSAHVKTISISTVTKYPYDSSSFRTRYFSQQTDLVIGLCYLSDLSLEYSVGSLMSIQVLTYK